MTFLQLVMTDSGAAAGLATLVVIASAFVVFLVKDNTRHFDQLRKAQANADATRKNSPNRLAQEKAAAEAYLTDLSNQLGFTIGKGE